MYVEDLLSLAVASDFANLTGSLPRNFQGDQGCRSDPFCDLENSLHSYKN